GRPRRAEEDEHPVRLPGEPGLAGGPRVGRPGALPDLIETRGAEGLEENPPPRPGPVLVPSEPLQPIARHDMHSPLPGVLPPPPRVRSTNLRKKPPPPPGFFRFRRTSFVKRITQMVCHKALAGKARPSN